MMFPAGDKIEGADYHRSMGAESQVEGRLGTERKARNEEQEMSGP